MTTTVRIGVVRRLLAYCAITKRQMRQIDFTTAFLNALIEEKTEIYVEQPWSFTKVIMKNFSARVIIALRWKILYID